MTLLLNILIAVALPALVWLISVKKRKAKTAKRALIVGTAAALAAVFYSSSMVVETGTVKIVRTFGEIHPRSYKEGLHLINPMSKRTSMEIRRTLFELQSGPEASQSYDVPASKLAAKALNAPNPTAGAASVSISKDRAPLTIDVGFPYKLNDDLAWRVFQLIGPTYKNRVLLPAARTAVRDAVAQFTWADAVTGRREELAHKMHSLYQDIVQNDLVQAGFTTDEAKTVFELMPVQVRRMLPPPRILTAVSERLAAEEDLQRQRILTEVAKQEANRRANEGLGVKKLFNELPRGFTAGQISQVLAALADKQRADALMKAVENERVSVVFMGGGNGNAAPALSLPQMAPTAPAPATK